MKRDLFAETAATYKSEAGAVAWVAKEKKFEERRNAWAYAMMDEVAVSGLRALDVGCGYGRDVAELRRRGTEAYGCDMSEPLLEMAEQNYGPYFKNHDLRSANDFPFDGMFDLIWCYAVLVHIPRQELEYVLTKMWGILKPGGTLVVSSKQGSGEAVSVNLGEDLPRIMVFYEVEDIINPLRRLGAEIEVMDAVPSRTAFDEPLLGVRARKVG